MWTNELFARGANQLRVLGEMVPIAMSWNTFEMPSFHHVIALGSSFAAGPGIEPVVMAPAMRSGRNYAHVLADALGAELTDLTVSGATTATIVDKSQRVFWRKFPPQVEGIPSSGDLITITAGGNDLGYIGSLLRIAWNSRLRERRSSRLIGDVLKGKGVPRASSVDVRGAASGLTRIVEAMRWRAPRARILLVDCWLSAMLPRRQARS